MQARASAGFAFAALRFFRFGFSAPSTGLASVAAASPWLSLGPGRRFGLIGPGLVASAGFGSGLAQRCLKLPVHCGGRGRRGISGGCVDAGGQR